MSFCFSPPFLTSASEAILCCYYQLLLICASFLANLLTSIADSASLLICYGFLYRLLFPDSLSISLYRDLFDSPFKFLPLFLLFHNRLSYSRSLHSSPFLFSAIIFILFASFLRFSLPNYHRKKTIFFPLFRFLPSSSFLSSTPLANLFSSPHSITSAF